MQKEKEEIKKVTMTIRLTEKELARIKRACHRDELRPSLFAHERIMTGVDELIKQQEIRGFQCSSPL